MINILNRFVIGTSTEMVVGLKAGLALGVMHME